ncbi:hypothetical protein B0H17DRAFT_1145482 [Mycena rosella]|uniref:Uncharacterized protein n=1 Tax=Mycena rosella TaxID=1033263 RepID=A0AAD7CTF2_MYCRO|nr:hypothetical protein B0H17DRAFT_1145482 [Mycena rosella]
MLLARVFLRIRLRRGLWIQRRPSSLSAPASLSSFPLVTADDGLSALGSPARRVGPHAFDLRSRVSATGRPGKEESKAPVPSMHGRSMWWQRRDRLGEVAFEVDILVLVTADVLQGRSFWPKFAVRGMLRALLRLPLGTFPKVFGQFYGVTEALL